MAIRKITIENLLGINRLEFDLPSKPDVYLLVGPNGTGKTTLLTCLDRIKKSYRLPPGLSLLEGHWKYRSIRQCVYHIRIECRICNLH